MVREASPKKLQREKRFSEAFEGYVERYIASLNEGDRFISAIYLDEIIQTILMQTETRTEGNLRGWLERITERIPDDYMRDFRDDIEIAIIKRFPEKYKVKEKKEKEEFTDED